jgi:hypothetical protein
MPVHRSRILYGASAFIGNLVVFIVLNVLSSRAEDVPRRFQIALGQSQSAISSACGKPFERSREDESSYNVSIGMPLGLWSVYHLIPFGDRMYVTIVHFDTEDKVDALMLMPNGTWTVTQILKDHPSMAEICSNSCELVQVPEKNGNISLLLKPKSTDSSTRVLYFIGDSGSKFKSVTATDSIVSWGYVLQFAEFEKRHAGIPIKSIGTWSP